MAAGLFGGFARHLPRSQVVQVFHVPLCFSAIHIYSVTNEPTEYIFRFIYTVCIYTNGDIYKLAIAHILVYLVKQYSVRLDALMCVCTSMLIA